MIYIDNIEGSLKSPSLSRALTSTQWSDRLLGKSEMLSLPQTACWYANGNRLLLGGDLPRRGYLVRMDAKMAHPWERDPCKFKHSDIKGWVTENRGKLLAALLTMARAWVVAGRPPGTGKVIGGYTEWVEILDGILKHAGVTGFLGNLDELYRQADEGTDQWQRFFEIWYLLFEDRVVSSKEVVTQLEKLDTDFSTEAPEEISKAMSGNKIGRVIRVGLKLMKKNKVRHENGYMLIKGEDKAGSKKTWQLLRIDGETCS
jgi:putative DNA primase/helicase